MRHRTGRSTLCHRLLATALAKLWSQAETTEKAGSSFKRHRTAADHDPCRL